jgi:hypothetical protein
LIVLLAIDQLRPDRLTEELPGGLGRLLREGRVFSDASLAHAHTETCPGHVTMLSGRHPGPSGIPGNAFVLRGDFRSVYCVEDSAQQAAVFGSPNGRSPRNIEATTFGDWLKAAIPNARVFSLSAKDRSAIALGGQHPDAAYWLDSTGAGRFTSSRYYLDALPGWVEHWTPEEIVSAAPEHWTHESGDPPNGARRDDYHYESDRFGRTSPHPLRTPENPSSRIAGFVYSPFVDSITLAFARLLVRKELLGTGADPDLLAISLSGTDYVGHFYGPESQEARDALLRLDRELGSFLDFLEGVGRGRLLVVLTADHGVLPVPEWLKEKGRSSCSLPSGRGVADDIASQLNAALNAELGEPPGETGWVLFASFRVTLNRALARERNVPLERVASLAKAHLEAQTGIARVWTAAEIEAGSGPEPFASLYRNSHHPERGGDLVIQPERDCLFSRFRSGTSHGSPYDYDRAVPLVFYGLGIEAGRSSTRAATVDIAPTLAELVRIPVPDGLDGRPLPLGGE